MESLGERIKKVMEVRGKNQTEFAATLGISSAAISQMISGKSGASNGTLFRISDVFGINLEWLKTGEGNMEKALPLKKELTARFSQLIGTDMPYRDEIICCLSDLGPAEWKIIGATITKMADKIKENEAEE